MQVGLVVGNATATIKHASFRGARFLLVQPYLSDGKAPDGDPQLCVDFLGAGIGETVVISSDGKFTREVLKSDATPARWTVIGIKD